ncbi:MAG TPA: TatD family hydrolase [Spirochaetota bacterium]|nr:TatD family hydrolase [Spirochaetota bacterium]HPI91110.1 TatD family hydrolase [Spirochaetota bacterium]HPR48683.1 TatD family hydrolase [Spirochaetota bacterium]
MLVDSHAHFDLTLENRDISESELIAALGEHHVTHAVQVSIDPAGFSWSREFAVKHRTKGILFTLGIHPSSDAGDDELRTLENFTTEVMSGKDAHLLFGIGECGLDFYRMRQSGETQFRSFEFQIDLALRYYLPVIVHSRNAMDETINLLWRKKPGRGIIHCFSGTPHDAKSFLDMGFYISFAGNVTYPKAQNLQDSARYVPLDRLLVETDSPFLTPVPMRGRQNRPHNVHYTYQFIADLRGESMSRLEKAVYENFDRLRK